MKNNLRPTLIVFADPNGSGKSSDTEKVKRICGSYPDLYINADEIALEKGLDAYAAAMEAERRRTEALVNNISYSNYHVVRNALQNPNVTAHPI